MLNDLKLMRRYSGIVEGWAKKFTENKALPKRKFLYTPVSASDMQLKLGFFCLERLKYREKSKNFVLMV